MMNISISTYEVKAGDTLESVAMRLGISPEALKRYHNTYCDLKNLIGSDFNGVQEIMLPPKEKIEELKENQKNTEMKAGLPSFYLNQNFYASNYDVTESIEQSGKEGLVLEYSVSLNLRENFEKGFVAEVKTFDFKKNKQTPDDKISILSFACMETIFPIEFIVPMQGKITGFYDYQKIVKNFEAKKPDLEDFFIGEVNKIYIDKFSRSINNENYMLEQFRSALLYQILFPEMDWFRRKKEWEEKVYVVPNSFPVNCKLHTEYNFENLENVEIIIKGDIDDNCSLQELLKGVELKELSQEK
ncbi:LysM peptidoglycan-binding domain-containing protein [Chryseobacterium indoltheticum]|uniref:LysM peptidoglycan-binding domain-containing protein n=1 Tax=Chryseobacterium indoltheticum TaxID=254 RepID=UPI003F498568